SMVCNSHEEIYSEGPWCVKSNVRARDLGTPGMKRCILQNHGVYRTMSELEILEHQP
ncbi:hypothetical protein NDU88_012034, partial [Pleurodeles waltl]